MYTDNRFASGIFSEADRGLLATFSDQAAIALENARLFESVRRTLSEVTELKNLMDNVFASIASGVITTDMHDQVTLCNLAARTILGELQLDMTGQSLHEIQPFNQDIPESSNLHRQIHNVQQTGHQVVGLEVNPRLSKRGVVNLSFNLSPLKNASQDSSGRCHCGQ